jgi:hypothetical protein
MFTSCAPTEAEANAVFETPLPEGDYEVRVVAYPEIAPGQWATAVSEPVAVRMDADGAHTATGTRGGESTIEPPAPASGEQTRFLLDRTSDWATAEQTQRGYSTDDTMAVTARCESSDSTDAVDLEVVLPSTGKVLGSWDVRCSKADTVALLGVLAGGEEALDLRLSTVPDGVARLWAVLAPYTDGCSATGPNMAYDPANSPSAGAGATAQAIVEAASSCDSDSLIELANQYSTELLIPAEPAEQVFALPEGDTEHYWTLVALLAGTEGAVTGGDPGNESVVWPRVVAEEFRDSDEAWQEVVEAGLLTADEAQAQRADEVFGYTGMRIAIAEDGRWRYYSATP